jgi:hypothetical protein
LTFSGDVGLSATFGTVDGRAANNSRASSRNSLAPAALTINVEASSSDVNFFIVFSYIYNNSKI